MRKSIGIDAVIYTRPQGSIAAQVEAILIGPGFDPSLPLYVTGHSLGAALAVVCAMDVGVNMAGQVKSGGLSMINFAGPLVAAGVTFDGYAVPPFGKVRLFLKAYARTVPASWRVVNAADLVPILPPGSVGMDGIEVDFAHVTPNVVTFCVQTGAIGGNHSLEDTYLPYMAGLAEA